MPNKYKVEFTIVDDFEKLEETPLDVEDIKNEIVVDLGCDLEIEGEINVIKLE